MLRMIGGWIIGEVVDVSSNAATSVVRGTKNMIQDVQDYTRRPNYEKQKNEIENRRKVLHDRRMEVQKKIKLFDANHQKESALEREKYKNLQALVLECLNDTTNLTKLQKESLFKLQQTKTLAAFNSLLEELIAQGIKLNGLHEVKPSDTSFKPKI